MVEIKRDAYLQQLILRKDNGMIKVITGIRRCGKSFLLFNIFKRYLLENGVDSDHIIEIALDGIENEELRDPKVCFKYIKDAMKDDEKYYFYDPWLDKGIIGYEKSLVVQRYGEMGKQALALVKVNEN